jgi:TetR/AcrR family transcriptional regulator, regulator of cefoperazone and chloramphenicol sensitivity
MRTDGTAPRRHPEQGGYACGEMTRARIIAAAIRTFGDEGYDQASTRKIAASAGVNPPALQYYFDSKEGLHRACAEDIIDRVHATLAPALEGAAAAVRARNAEQALDALCVLLQALVDGLVAAGAESWSRFVARGKVDGAGPAVSMIHERISTPLVDATARLVGLATHRPAGAEATRLRACTVLGQVSALYANRGNTLAVMGWSQFDARALALIKDVVCAHTRAALRGEVAEGVAAARPRRSPSRAAARR